MLKHNSYHIIVTVWPTIKKTQLFNREPNKALGLKYEKSGEQLAEEKWLQQLKNTNNGEFFQLEDLRAIGAVPSDFRKNEKPKKYPVMKVDSIIRIKKADGSEWLKSRQTWIGLDRLGNDITNALLILSCMINLFLIINPNQKIQETRLARLKEMLYLLLMSKSLLCHFQQRTLNNRTRMFKSC